MNFNFKNRVSLEEQKAMMEERFIRDRQIASMIYEYFQITGAHNAVLDDPDLFRITLHGDDIQDFVTRWHDALLFTKESSNDGILESL